MMKADLAALAPFLKDEFADMWDDYTECDWRLITDPTSFLEKCEDAGLAECVDVDDAALNESFAAERGIEPDGMMWRLTPEGQERYRACRPRPAGKGECQ